MRHISDETLERTRQLRALGLSWEKIGRQVGFGPDVLRYRLDPTRKRGGESGLSSMIRDLPYRPTEAEVDRLLSTIPRDTRNFTSRVCGDPLPGRSALDQRRQSCDVFHTKIGSPQPGPR